MSQNEKPDKEVEALDTILEVNRLNELIFFEINRYVQNQLPPKITPKQQLCLLFLGNSGSSLTGKIAEILGISKSSLSQLLNRLEEDCYIQRRINPENRKEVFVDLDENGRRYYSTYVRSKREVFQRFYNTVTTEEADFLLRFNQKILSGIQSGQTG